MYRKILVALDTTASDQELLPAITALAPSAAAVAAGARVHGW